MSFLFGVIATLGVLHVIRHRTPRLAGPSRVRSRFSPGAAMHRRWMRRWHLRHVEGLADRLDASPAQARVLAEEAEGLFEQAHRLHRGVALRGVFAGALRADAFDRAAVEGALDTGAEALRGLKDRALATVERLRAELDPEQRQELAELVEKGPHSRFRCGPARG
jgi:hypothetical protein